MLASRVAIQGNPGCLNDISIPTMDVGGGTNDIFRDLEAPVFQTIF